MVLIKNIIMDTPDYLLFVCNHIPIILAILLITQKYQIIKSLINVAFIVQLGWMLDLLSKLIFNTYLFGSTVYIFNSHAPFGHAVSIAIHATTLIPALFITRNIKPVKNTVLISAAYIVIIYILSRLFTDPALDINCVFNMCKVNFLLFADSKYIFFPVIFLLIIMPTYYFQLYLSKTTKS